MSCILDRLTSEDLTEDPFPFFDKRNCLDADFYSRLAGSFPKIEFKADAPSNKLRLASLPSRLKEWDLDPIWKDFSDTHLDYNFGSIRET